MFQFPYYLVHNFGSDNCNKFSAVSVQFFQKVKNPPAMQETQVRSKSGRSPGRGNGNPLQYSCLENSMDRGAWQATVHGVAKNQIVLKD